MISTLSRNSFFKLRVSVATWVLSGALIVFGSAYIYLVMHANVEYYSKSIYGSAESRKNPFLAASLFMKKFDKNLELQQTFTLIDQTLDPSDTLIISNSRKPLSASRLQSIKDFVSDGGHLVLNAVEVHNDETGVSGDPLLDELGIRLYEDESPTRFFDFFAEDEDELELESIDEESDRYHASFTFEGYQAPTKVYFQRPRYLVDANGEASFIGGSDESDHLIQYPYGDGMITVMSDMRFWENNRIDDADHAMFLYQLTANSPNIWIVYNPQVASLFSLLWKHAYPLLLSVMIILIAVIWFYQMKTGPVFDQFSVHSRQLMQHIAASAEFKYNRGDANQLLKQTRDDLTARLKRRVRNFQKLSIDQQLDAVIDLSGLNRQQLKLALLDDFIDHTTFVEQITCLQIIRTHLFRKTL